MGNADFRVPRKAWYKPSENDHARAQETTLSESQWLSEWREEPAYVLLGDPGSGKTESLKAEAEAVGGALVSAALIEAGVAPSVGADALVFIDAVDEVKGSGSGNVVGAVARYLRDNGKPRFRIACREADWRVTDRALLEAVAPAGRVKELHLSPLSDQDIQDILKSRSQDVPDAQAFIEQAQKQGVQDWLGNPLLLNLMVASVAQNGQLPTSRMGIYESACHAMAQEHNDRHREKQALSAGVVQTVLEDAGGLCALLLLSGQSAISKSAQPAAQVLALPALPKDLELHDIKHAVKSKLFSTEGDLIRPRHRTIAEFLGAQALAKRIQKGLPLSRVLALVQGHDGVPVESMRGLCAWLAVHLKGEQRRLVIQADPLGFIINGDAAELTHDERVELMRALAELSQQNPWFRSGQWESHPFGSLATLDMQEFFRQELARRERSQAHQLFIKCLLDALQNASQTMPSLLPLLARWVMDAQAQEFVRVSAYHAWKWHVPPHEQGEQIKAWLNDLEDQREKTQTLVEEILKDAYPKLIQTEVLRFLPREQRSISVWWFWAHHFMRLTPPTLLPALANAWRAQFPRGVSAPFGRSCKEVQSQLLCTVLEKHGDTASTRELYEWLAIGLDEDGWPEQSEQNQSLTDWLKARPEKVKAIALLCWQAVEPDAQGKKFYPWALQRLRGVALPSNWVRWQMDVALTCHDADLVRYLLMDVKGSVRLGNANWDLPAGTEVSAWLEALRVQYPNLPAWIQSVEHEQQKLEKQTDDLKKEQRERQARAQAEKKHARQRRKKSIAPYLARLYQEPLPAGLLDKLAGAYEKRFYDIQGETPEARVADLLGADSQDDVNKALQAIDGCLLRKDLPDFQAALKVSEKSTPGTNYCHALCRAGLLAARRACERDPQAWRAWPTFTQQTVLAFWLTYAAEENPIWLVPLGAECPDVVAPVLLANARSKFKQKSFQSIAGLWHLTQEPTWQTLAGRVLPELLESFPLVAGEHFNRVLNQDLLSALHLLPNDQAQVLVEKKLARKSLDGGQRIAWLVAWLRYEPVRAIEKLVEHVDNVEARRRRVVIVGSALRQQGVLSQNTVPLPVACVQRLIEWFAPMTSAADWPVGFVTEDAERADMVHALLSNLGNNPSPEASQALQSLASNAKLKDWQHRAQFHLQQQRRLLREAQFKTPSVQAVVQVLCQKMPANPADLQALTLAHLEDIQAELRGDPAFQLRHFWHGNLGTLKAIKGKHDKVPSEENDCSRELFDKLRPRLQAQGVVLSPEVQAANDKRVDLLATCVNGQQIKLMVEAKKENHPKLWTAWRDQLQALYTIDPASGGRGIYLVYWFGLWPKAAPPLDPSQPNVKPQSAKEMQAMLEERIPEKDRHLLRVVVLDLSWPEESKANIGAGLC